MRLQIKKRSIFKQIVLFIFSLGLVGLVFSSGDLSRIGYEVGKVVWLQWWVRALALCLWGLVLVQPQKTQFKFFSRKNSLYLGLLILVVLLAAARGVNWQQSLWGNYYRGDGLLTWLHLIVVSFLASWLLTKKEAQELVPASLGVAGLLLVVSSLFPQLGSWLRVGFGNPNIAAGFLVVIAPLVMFGARKFNGIARLVILSLLFIATIYLQAWGSVISLGLGLVMYRWLSRSPLNEWVVVAPIVILVIGVIGLMRWQPVGNSQFTESRVRIFHKLGRAVVQRPVLGWGWANVDVAFESVDWPVAVESEAYVDKAHSELLELAVTSGFLGLGLYLLFLSGVYKEVVSSLKTNDEWGRTLLLTCLLYFFHSQTNVISVAESVVFWISLGLLLSTQKLKG
jgi:O-antigen ligase